MTTTSRRPRRKPGENRERLLEAGLIEFGLLGYHGASTAAIASRADVPQPHVYSSFATKRELFLACVVRVVKGLSLWGDARTPGSVADADARLLFQAVAAARSHELAPDLGRVLDDLEEHLGEERLLAVVARGAAVLLDPESSASPASPASPESPASLESPTSLG